MESDETENAPTIELTRRRALAGLATIGVGSAAAGAGTFATFNDSESTTGGFSAGTLTLSMGDTSLDFSPGGDKIAPGDEGSAAVRLVPEGSMSGNLVPNLVETKNTTTGKDDNYVLEDHLRFRIWLDEGREDDSNYGTNDIALQSNGDSGTGKSLEWDSVNNYKNASWGEVIAPMNNTWTFHVKWELPDTTPNQAQGDGFDTKFEFTLR